MFTFTSVCLLSYIMICKYVSMICKYVYLHQYVTYVYISIISTDEDPSLRIESSAIINLRGVSTKLNK